MNAKQARLLPVVVAFQRGAGSWALGIVTAGLFIRIEIQSAQVAGCLISGLAFAAPEWAKYRMEAKP